MDTCSHCGADLPRRAKACPECGSDEKTGWSEAASASALGIPDDKFDYNEFIQNEFGTAKPPRRKLQWLWVTVAIGIILLFVLSFFR